MKVIVNYASGRYEDFELDSENIDADEIYVYIALCNDVGIAIPKQDVESIKIIDL